jgi:hypothetical protein
MTIEQFLGRLALATTILATFMFAINLQDEVTGFLATVATTGCRSRSAWFVPSAAWLLASPWWPRTPKVGRSRE